MTSLTHKSHHDVSVANFEHIDTSWEIICNNSMDILIPVIIIFTLSEFE